MTTLKDIQSALDAGDWRMRELLPAKLAVLVESHECGSDGQLDLWLRLARDQKWEVRLAVVEACTNLPHDIFASVIAIVLDDQSTYVRRAAQRARRQRDQTYRPSAGTKPVSSLQRELTRLILARGNEPELRMAAERLVRKARGEGIMEFAHEVRGLLHPLSSAAGRLDAELSPAARKKHAKTLERIQQQCASIKRLVDAMHFMAQGKDLKFDFALLPEVVGQVAAHLEPLAREKGVRLQIAPVPELAAYVVPERLVQALDNVVRNAIEATPPHGAVHMDVKFAHESGEVEFVVRDQGRGIPRDEYEDIFRMFRTGKGEEGHSGIGLAVAQQVVESEHSGRIAVESDGFTYTIFRIRIPRERGK